MWQEVPEISILKSVKTLHHNRRMKPGTRRRTEYLSRVREDEKCMQNFGKQQTVRELEDTGVDRRILKHNR